jgi:hypothetical protein
MSGCQSINAVLVLLCACSKPSGHPAYANALNAVSNFNVHDTTAISKRVSFCYAIIDLDTNGRSKLAGVLAVMVTTGVAVSKAGAAYLMSDRAGDGVRVDIADIQDSVEHADIITGLIGLQNRICELSVEALCKAANNEAESATTLVGSLVRACVTFLYGNWEVLAKCESWFNMCEQRNGNQKRYFVPVLRELALVGTHIVYSLMWWGLLGKWLLDDRCTEALWFLLTGAYAGFSRECTQQHDFDIFGECSHCLSIIQRGVVGSHDLGLTLPAGFCDDARELLDALNTRLADNSLRGARHGSHPNVVQRCKSQSSREAKLTDDSHLHLVAGMYIREMQERNITSSTARVRDESSDDRESESKGKGGREGGRGQGLLLTCSDDEPPAKQRSGRNRVWFGSTQGASPVSSLLRRSVNTRVRRSRMCKLGLGSEAEGDNE